MRVKKTIILGSISIIILLLSTQTTIGLVQHKIVTDEVEKTVEKYTMNTFFQSVYNKDLSFLKPLLILLTIIDIPMILLSLIVSLIIYLIYIPVQLVTLIFTLLFWDPDIPVAIPPVFIVMDLFLIILTIVGLPIIFFAGTIRFINDIENKEYIEYLQTSFVNYVNFLYLIMGGR